MGRHKPVEAGTYTPKEKAVNKGFYYDSQIEDPMLSISLHPNTIPGKDKFKDGWEVCTGDTLEITIGGEYDKYRREPLARAIMTEDFIYSITNNFTDNDMGNPIENIFNNLKPYAPIVGKFADGLGKGADSMKEDDMGSYLVKKANQFAGWIAPKLKEGSSFLNNALMMQGTRFTYYSGTSFNINNMEFKFIAFSDWINEGKEFQPVNEYVDLIRPYVMGKYHPVTSELTGTDADKFIAQYVGYQIPPAGFKMDTQNLNNILRGTLRLNIGGMYAISNLVIKNMTVNLSKAQAKDPRDGKEGSTVPLYAEISLQLAPACSLVDGPFEAIVNNIGVKKDIIEPVQESYKSKMKNLQIDLETRLNSMDSRLEDDLRVYINQLKANNWNYKKLL